MKLKPKLKLKKIKPQLAKIVEITEDCRHISLPLKMLVGLGNRGPEYSLTRHNAGFWYIDKLAACYGVRFNYEKKFNAEICRIKNPVIDCWLCKPQTFMNNSGDSVLALANFYQFQTTQILIAHDELDFDVGDLKIKKAGGHGGHKGLRSIIKQLNKNDFYRIRIGVGRPLIGNDVTNYLLSKPGKEEQLKISQAIDNAIFYRDKILSGMIINAMNEINPKTS